MQYILDSTFPRFFLFLELNLQQETQIYTININLQTLFLLLLSFLDNYFILIGHLK